MNHLQSACVTARAAHSYVKPACCIGSLIGNRLLRRVVSPVKCSFVSVAAASIAVPHGLDDMPDPAVTEAAAQHQWFQAQ